MSKVLLQHKRYAYEVVKIVSKMESSRFGKALDDDFYKTSFPRKKRFKRFQQT